MSEKNLAMNLFREFATDPKAEENGVWEEMRPGVKFLIAAEGNDRYQNRMQVEYKKHRRLLDSGTPEAEAKFKEITLEVLAETVLLGWEGVADDNGLMPYSLEASKRALEMRVFREWVQTRSKDWTKYKLYKDEADAKN